MAVKIITLDLDGTLMSPDHLTVSQENKDALRVAHEKGVKLLLRQAERLPLWAMSARRFRRWIISFIQTAPVLLTEKPASDFIQTL